LELEDRFSWFGGNPYQVEQDVLGGLLEASASLFWREVDSVLRVGLD
jgi:hypothetical protein